MGRPDGWNAGDRSLKSKKCGAFEGCPLDGARGWPRSLREWAAAHTRSEGQLICLCAFAHGPNRPPFARGCATGGVRGVGPQITAVGGQILFRAARLELGNRSACEKRVAPTPPGCVGLSHLAQQLEAVVVVPAGALQFDLQVILSRCRLRRDRGRGGAEPRCWPGHYPCDFARHPRPWRRRGPNAGRSRCPNARAGRQQRGGFHVADSTKKRSFVSTLPSICACRDDAAERFQTRKLVMSPRCRRRRRWRRASRSDRARRSRPSTSDATARFSRSSARASDSKVS